MTKDVQNWKSSPDDALSEDERLVIKRCLGFFAGSESLVANNLMTLSSILLILNAGSTWQGRCMKSVYTITR